MRLELLGDVLGLVLLLLMLRGRGSGVLQAELLGALQRLCAPPVGAALEQLERGCARGFDCALEVSVARLFCPLLREEFSLVVIVSAVELEDFFGRWVSAGYLRRLWT